METSFFHFIQPHFEGSAQKNSVLSFYSSLFPKETKAISLESIWSKLLEILFTQSKIILPYKIITGLARELNAFYGLDPRSKITQIFDRHGLSSFVVPYSKEISVLENFYSQKNIWFDGSIIQSLKLDFEKNFKKIRNSLDISDWDLADLLNSISFKVPFSLKVARSYYRFNGLEAQEIDYWEWNKEILDSYQNVDDFHLYEFYLDLFEESSILAKNFNLCELEQPNCKKCLFKQECKYFLSEGYLIESIKSKILTNEVHHLTKMELTKVFLYFIQARNTIFDSIDSERLKDIFFSKSIEFNPDLLGSLGTFKKTIEAIVNKSKEDFYEKEIKIKGSKSIYEFVKNDLKDALQEYFYLLLLDSKNNLIKFHNISKGLLDKSLVRPREIFQVAIQLNAASIVLVHNHPSGDLTPSVSDKKITKRIVQVGELMGLEIIDHLIVTDAGYFSFSDEGLIF